MKLELLRVLIWVGALIALAGLGWISVLQPGVLNIANALLLAIGVGIIVLALALSRTKP